MMRIILAISMAAAALISFGCKPAGKYADLKEYLNDYTAINEEYISTLEKANSAKDVADAINTLSGKMENIIARSETLNKKYPEIKTFDRKNPPSELKEEYERIDKMMQNLLTVTMKMMKYMTDPEVMKANQEMSKRMGSSGLIR